MKKRHKEHHEEHVDESWLVPYSDLLTLLLALFIVLFASSQVDQKKFDQIKESFNDAFTGGLSFFETSPSPIDQSGGYTDPDTEVYPSPTDSTIDSDTLAALQEEQELKMEQMQQEQLELEELKKQLDEYIENNGLKDQLGTKLNESSLLITIRDNALFDSGSAEVKADSEKMAHAIGDLLKAYPEYEVIIAGHTDNRPISTAQFPSNWDLSTERALNFMKILLEDKQLKPERFSATGYGEYRPVASNDTNVGRAQNRRVEVSILRKFKEDKVEISTTDQQ
ncbi:flagellar motor protein MotB [Marinicrinis lubricantis]|uniref:Flagellar motor protein MotB n=1 Tax=Marinicrinis lubricantis TaxID=2086470 RepID=A0ABW1IVJ1_9BACL